MSGKGRKREAKKELAKPYEPTPHERAAMEDYFAQRKESPPAPRVRSRRSSRSCAIGTAKTRPLSCSRPTSIAGI